MTANPTKQALESARNRGPALRRHELVAAADQRGPIDDLSATEVIKGLPLLPVWPGSDSARGVRLDRVNGAAEVLAWLAKHPGDGWQDRWLASGADQDLAWMNIDTPSHRQQLKLGLNCLLLAQLVRPSYEFLWRYRSSTLFREVRVVFRPDLFATMEDKARERGIDQRRTDAAFLVLARMILHTGRELDQLTTDAFLVAREWDMILYGRSRPGAHLAWELLRPIAPLNAPTLHDALRVGQLSSEGLVDKYRIRCRPVRDVLVRYLEERRAALDYSSLTSLANVLVGQFWADIERHHPDVDSLKLPHDVVQAWKQRHRVVEHSDGTVRPRAVYLGDLSLVRAFYLDIQEWAEEDPSWLPWVTPSPIRKRDLAGMGKAKKQVTAKMHQRVRDRLPHLPILVDTAEHHRTDHAALLAAATATEIGTVFEHNHRTYRRTASAVHLKRNRTIGTARRSILAEDIATGEVIDLTRAEDDAFWAWAALETLRLTGVRVEELVEITHLGMVSYQLPDTGEVVPMLQIVPSKSNEERLLPVD